ncbi:uncharacterized protein LOC134275196 [Saccostrea cucullata]|uniref:uncharacterized protein LOC134275196 n=1 Tax=Saccostrea cuccullata TaxID=36930 RepID=UPI002ED3C479
MGDIDVWKILEELEDRGLVERDREMFNSDRAVYHVSINKEHEISQSFIENCLLSDIDRDFLIDVAEVFPLYTWYTTQDLIINRDISSPQASRSITVMRLIMEGRMDVVGDIIEYTDDILLPAGYVAELDGFVQFWENHCKRRNIHPTDWSNGVRDEEMLRYFSTYLFLSGYEEEFLKLALNKSKWSILILILMSEKYSILYEEKLLEEKVDKIQQTFLSLNGSDDGMSNYTFLIQDLIHNDKLLTMHRENKALEFISEDIRHQVMGYFVLNCLLSDEDYKNYIQLSSFDSLFDYVRTMWYKREKQEKYVFIPRRMEETLVRRIGIDILRHATLEDDKMKDIVCKTLNIPREILYWDYDARCRYIECAKKGTQTIHRARAMIVGCAGAGKTTLLKRLQKRSLDELQQVQSTIGLEVHEDIFEISEDKCFLTAVKEETEKEGKQLLSVMDFGGQCAYYACHQVYLSRRAFYLLVIDMSKSFYERIDRRFCDQEETMFADWTYGEYLLFWMKSVHMYCDEAAPVILVGTHLDKTTGQTTNSFYNSIIKHLRFDKSLKKHLDRKRCFLVGFQNKNDPSLDDLSDLMICIASIAKEDRWKETIPADWALGESTLRYLRGQNRRVISKEDFQKECFGKIYEKYKQVPDILKLFHEIGVILNFKDDVLSETVIIDIQWFVDAFKNIITDLNHVMDVVENNDDWQNFYQNGYMSDLLLEEIWSTKGFKVGTFKSTILQYMQRLGLLVVGDNQHYIPCINKCTFDATHEDSFRRWENKTSVLVLRFQFLPYFIFCRLVVACITRTDGEWGFLNDQGLRLFKDVACFAYKDHKVALAVNHSSIQIQVFKPGNSILEKKVTLEVLSTIERLLKELSGTFHQEIMYTVGYQCSMNEVFREYDGCFVEETEIYSKGQIDCPRHALLHHHVLRESDLLYHWKQDCKIENPRNPVAALRQDNFIVAYEEGLRKFNFKTFEQLTKVGRDALQIYFDKEFPLKDLVSMSSRQAKVKKALRLNDDQCAKLFPANKSNPSSEMFDVTMMYTMLRNRNPSIQSPTKGWGKTPETSDTRLTDDVERIRIYRNEIGHATEATSKLEKKELEKKARDLMQAILGLSNGVLKQKMMNVLEGRT